MSVETLLEIKNLSIYIKNKSKSKKVVDNLSFKINKKEITALLGESGCGKTLTALSIMQLKKDSIMSIDPKSKIIFSGENLNNFPNSKMQKIRGNKITMVFQEPMNALNPVYKIGNQMAEILTTHKKITHKQALKESYEMLKELLIPNPKECIKSYPHQLSGGMKQRILIGMSLLCKPKLIIADEPTTSLDVNTQYQILKLLYNMQKKLSTAILFITHNINIVKQISDKVIILHKGKIVETNTTKEIFNNPQHHYSKKLFQSIRILGKNNI